MSDYDVLSFGETMAMLVAEQSGDLASVEHFHKRIAGADSNVAIGLSRLGFKVAWLCRVGADSLGRFVVQTLEIEGLDCSHLSIDSIAPALLEARHLHATGIVPALSITAREMAFELMTRMREAGRSLSFDPNLRPSLWGSESTMIREINRLAALAHWVLPGLCEGRVLTGYEDPADIAAFYLDQGAEAVVIKLGADGAYYRTPDAQGFVAAVPDVQVVDTVGAGDGFAVGLISAQLENRSLDEAVQRANWIGSRAVQSRGDMEGLPTRLELSAELEGLDCERSNASLATG